VLATLAIGALVLSPVAQVAYAGELPAPPQSPAAEHPAQATTGSVPTYSQGLRSQKALIADVPDDSTASTPTPEQRLTRVDVARDLVKKTITAKATFAEAPTSDRDSAVYVFLGTWSGSSCTGRVVTAAAAASRSQFGALLGSDGTVDEEVDTTRSRSGKVLTIVTGPHDRIRTAKLDCAYALNLGAGDPAPRYTDFYAEDLENTFAPKLEVSTREPLQGNYKGKTTKVRIEVDNIGESLGHRPEDLQAESYDRQDRRRAVEVPHFQRHAHEQEAAHPDGHRRGNRRQEGQHQGDDRREAQA
jgi:hypothetical protein